GLIGGAAVEAWVAGAVRERVRGAVICDGAMVRGLVRDEINGAGSTSRCESVTGTADRSVNDRGLSWSGPRVHAGISSAARRRRTTKVPSVSAPITASGVAKYHQRLS